MCGRFAITSPPEAVRAYFRYVEQPNFPPRYNIAPTQPIPLVCARGRASEDARLSTGYRASEDARLSTGYGASEDARLSTGYGASEDARLSTGYGASEDARLSTGYGGRHFMLARWGFLPGFVKDVKKFPLLINARAETLAEKPSFRAALRRRRCLIPADGWYEWRANPSGPKTPFLLRRADGGLMGFAGLWETYLDASGGEIDTACIITTSANGATAAIHDRMPAILARQDFDEWLDPDETVAPPLRLLRPAPEDEIEFFAITPKVNRASAEGPEIQIPV